MEGAEERAVRVAGNLQGLGVGAWVLGAGVLAWLGKKDTRTPTTG